MTLRFKIDQAAMFRSGINAPNSVVDVKVNPAHLDEETRGLIADRMVNGIDVCYLGSNPPKLILAGSHDIAGLIAAVKADAEKA